VGSAAAVCTPSARRHTESRFAAATAKCPCTIVSCEKLLSTKPLVSDNLLIPPRGLGWISGCSSHTLQVVTDKIHRGGSSGNALLEVGVMMDHDPRWLSSLIAIDEFHKPCIRCSSFRQKASRETNAIYFDLNDETVACSTCVSVAQEKKHRILQVSLSSAIQRYYLHF
jgi:hypothetical protein